MKKFSKTAALFLAVLLIGASAARAADGRKTFRIVLVPERNIFEQQRKYKNLCDYACTMIPVDFTFDVLKGYQDVLHALREGAADGAFMGSFIATYGIDKFGFIPLVRPMWASGNSHYSSYIFKTAGLPVTRDTASWKGRSFVFVGPHTSAGYYYPLSFLRKKGIQEPGEFFSRIQFAESHDTAVWMVANGVVDIGAAKNTVFEEFINRKPALKKKVVVLYKGGNFPDSTLLVRADLPQEVRESIRGVFLRMDSHTLGKDALKMFGAKKFMKTTSDEYSEVRQVVSDSGYDIKSIVIAERLMEPAR